MLLTTGGRAVARLRQALRQRCPSLLSLGQQPVRCQHSDLTAERNWFVHTLASPRSVYVPPYQPTLSTGAGSDRAFRLLCRQGGTQLALSPLMDAEGFVINKKFRRAVWPDPIMEDSPLLAQFAANDADELQKAVEMVADSSSGICLNLHWDDVKAERKSLGAYLLEHHPERIPGMIKRVRDMGVHVGCRIRAGSDWTETSQRLTLLRDAGVSLVFLDPSGMKSTEPLATLRHELGSQMSMILELPSSPANAANQLLAVSGADGVASCEALLCNPFEFGSKTISVAAAATKYANLCRAHATPPSVLRMHLGYMFCNTAVMEHDDLTSWLKRATTKHSLELLVTTVEDHQKRHGGGDSWHCRAGPVPSEWASDLVLPKNTRKKVERSFWSKVGNDPSLLTKPEMRGIPSPCPKPIAGNLTPGQTRRQYLRQALADNVPRLHFAVDCTMQDLMSNKEIRKLAAHINFIYGFNRGCKVPAEVTLCGLEPGNTLSAEALTMDIDFNTLVMRLTAGSPLETFPKDKLVYLTPDSEQPLEELKSDAIYVLGGLVDTSLITGKTLGMAKENGLETARLPVTEHFDKRHHGNSVLAINQVFEALMRHWHGEDWQDALSAVLPRRKGWEPKQMSAHELEAV